MADRLVFLWDSYQWERVCLWLFCLFFRLFSSYWIDLSSLDKRVFALYCILICFFGLLSLGVLKRETEEELIWELGEGVEGRKTLIGMYFKRE